MKGSVIIIKIEVNNDDDDDDDEKLFRLDI